MSKEEKTTYTYRVHGNGVRTGREKHTGTFEGALLKATRIANPECGEWRRGDGPVIEVTEEASGDKREVRL